MKCVERISPVVKRKHTAPRNVDRRGTVHGIRPPPFRYRDAVLLPPLPNSAAADATATAAKSTLLGLSLLGLFGLDEDVDPELKLINTIKRGLLYLQVIRVSIDR